MQSGHISLLEKVAADSVGYRARLVDVSDSFSQGSSPKEPLFKLLIATSELYLDSLLVLRALPSLFEVAIDGPDPDKHAIDISREMALRRHFRGVLESSQSWASLDLNHSMAGDNLSTREDYINNYSLHLPEINEETYHVEKYAQDFIATQNDGALIDLDIGMRHLAFNHAIFVLPALQWPSAQ